MDTKQLAPKAENYKTTHREESIRDRYCLARHEAIGFGRNLFDCITAWRNT